MKAKKIFSICLGALIIASNIFTSAHAASSSTIKVNLNNIRQIMTDNSLTLKTYENNLNSAEDSYNDAKDAYNDGYDDYYSLKKEIAALDSTSETYSTDLETLKEKLNAIDLDKLKSAKDSAQNSLKQLRLTNDQNIENAVYSAQKQYIDYLLDLSNNDLKTSKLQLEADQKKVLDLQYNSGFISKKEYDDSVADLTNSSNEMDTLKNTRELAYEKLCNTLGIDSSNKIVFNLDINSDLDVVSNINYQDDLDEMLDNSVDLKVKDLAIDQAEDDDDDDEGYKVDNAEISREQQENTAKENFKAQYNTLMSSYNTIKYDQTLVDSKQKDVNVAQLSYNSGFDSKQDLDNAKYALDDQNSKFKSDENTFYMNYLGYLKMKEGY